MAHQYTHVRLTVSFLKFLALIAISAVISSSSSSFARASQSARSEATNPLHFAHLHGDYYFYTIAKMNGHPVCSERWSFSDDGTLTTFSGQEVLREIFRIEDNNYKNEDIMITQIISSNGQPDCMQKITKFEKSYLVRTMLYQAKEGNFVLFNERFFKNGQRIHEAYALLYPSALVDNHGTAP